MEALAVRWSLKVAKSIGLRKVAVENDNLLQVMNTLWSKESGASTFLLIIEDIFSVVASFNDVLWSLVNRIFHNVAHLLAHPSPMEMSECIWDDEFPSYVVSNAHSDLMK